MGLGITLLRESAATAGCGNGIARRVRARTNLESQVEAALWPDLVPHFLFEERGK